MPGRRTWQCAIPTRSGSDGPITNRRRSNSLPLLIACWRAMSPDFEHRPLLLMRRIHKRFPGVHALRGVDLELHRGEVHALVGENGAGKSTLMHLLAGVYQPDEGRIDFDGTEAIRIANERAAQKLGIAIVFQERSLFNDLTIAENIF